MDRLISLQAAVDAIERRLAEPAYQHTGEDWYVGMNSAESELYELPSAQPEPQCDECQERQEARQAIAKYLSKEPQWIPCSERLPSARQSVILSTKEWTGEGCYWETTEHHVIWKGYRWNATYWDDEVIAWMPLPESYKGE